MGLLVHLTWDSIHGEDVAVVCDDLVLLELEPCVSAYFSEVSISIACVSTHWKCFIHVLLEPAVFSTVNLCDIHEFVIKLV